jgi:hypothetical protein
MNEMNEKHYAILLLLPNGKQKMLLSTPLIKPDGV